MLAAEIIAQAEDGEQVKTLALTTPRLSPTKTSTKASNYSQCSSLRILSHSSCAPPAVAMGNCLSLVRTRVWQFEDFENPLAAPRTKLEKISSGENPLEAAPRTPRGTPRRPAANFNTIAGIYMMADILESLYVTPCPAFPPPVGLGGCSAQTGRRGRTTSTHATPSLGGISRTKSWDLGSLNAVFTPHA